MNKKNYLNYASTAFSIMYISFIFFNSLLNPKDNRNIQNANELKTIMPQITNIYSTKANKTTSTKNTYSIKILEKFKNLL